MSINTLGVTPEDALAKDTAVKMIAELDMLDEHIYHSVLQDDEAHTSDSQ